MAQFFEFQILPSTPASMLNLANFRFQKPKTLQATSILVGRGVFLLKNRFSIFSQQFCPRLWFIDIFWKYCPRLLNGITMRSGALYALNSINSKLQKWFNKLFLIFSIKIWYFWRLPSICQIKHKNCLYIFKNQPKCLHSIKTYFSILITFKKKKNPNH